LLRGFRTPYLCGPRRALAIVSRALKFSAISRFKFPASFGETSQQIGWRVLTVGPAQQTGGSVTLLIWWSGLVLELVILARGLRAGMIKKYPYFYAYILCVFAISAGLYVGYRASPSFYRKWYWPTQFVTLVAGFGVLLDIVENALEAYPGAKRLLRHLSYAVLGAVFATFCLKIALGTLSNTAEIERDLRCMEALVLLLVGLVTSYFGIKLGKNLKGLILGFGMYVGVSLITLAVVLVAGKRFEPAWQILQSGSYLAALAIWTVGLWSYAPNPVANRIQIEYQVLASQTQVHLDAIRNHFEKTTKP
jgi:hypothetical protein